MTLLLIYISLGFVLLGVIAQVQGAKEAVKELEKYKQPKTLNNE